MELDHPSCYTPKGRYEAAGEWEASPDVLINLNSYGFSNGLSIDWVHDVESVELYKGTEPVADAYDQGEGIRWGQEAFDLSDLSRLWMLGVAWVWANHGADSWANTNRKLS